MKTNTTLIGEAARWLDSFGFIGPAFPIRGKKHTRDINNIANVVMCNTKEPSKPIQIVSYQEFIAYEKPMLIIQMGNDPQKLISKEAVSIISDRILIELAFGTPLADIEFNGVMNKYLGINYNDAFNSSKINDFNRLITGKEIPYQCLRLIEEVLAMIYDQGLTYDLMLETKVLPIYREIFLRGFLIDIKAMQDEYKMIENENRVMLQYFVDRYSITPDDTALYEHLDSDGIQVLQRYQKNQYMLTKYPMRKLIRMKDGKRCPYLTCSYKQIGTRTLRISTSQINIYGLPKRLRQHLIPSDGKIFVEADFHASELLIIANLAHEEWLVKAYQQGKDIYNMFATSFFHKKAIDIQSKERKAMKKLFFAYINGARMTTLHEILTALDIHISIEKMNIGLQHLKESIPKVIKYLKSLRYKANVLTPTGRWWSEDDLPEPKKRAAYIIQIVESEILFNAILMVQREVLQFEGMRIYLTKHDSITIEAPVEYADDAKTILNNNMTKAVQVFFDMTNVQINIDVTPYREEKEINTMKANKINETIKNNMMSQFNITTLRNLKQQLKSQKRTAMISTVRPVPEEEYLAIVKDVDFVEETNIARITFGVFIGNQLFTYQARFNLSTNAVFYYESMVQQLCDDDGCIVGALCYVVFHKNKQYLNIEVINVVSEEELGVDLNSVEDTQTKSMNVEKSTNLRQKSKYLVEPDEEDYDDYEDELQVEFDDEEVED